MANSGVIRADEGRILALSPAHRWPALDSRHEAEVRQRLILLNQTSGLSEAAGNLGVLAAILAAEGWTLARLARQDGGSQLPRSEFSHIPARGRRWVLPLLWEFGVPAAITVLPAKFKVNWTGTFLHGSDVSCALTAIGALTALTGLLRIAKARAPRGKTRSREGIKRPAAAR